MAYANSEDQKQYARQHYQDHKELYKSRAVASRNKIRSENRHNLAAYLQDHPCTDCGEPDIVVLQFDHTSDDKTDEIGRMLQDGVSWKRLLTEMAKCEVVCANCHIRRTARRHGGWYRLQWASGVMAAAPASNSGVREDVGVRLPSRPLDPA